MDDPGDAQIERALTLACAQLDRRERTVAEVALSLERRGVPQLAARRTIETLIGQGMLDDARFAAMFVSDKRALEHWGRERILRGLLARGVAQELAESTLAAVPGSVASGGAVAGDEPGIGALVDGRDAELERALELLRHRFPEPPRERRDRDRALGLLLRKGYESELALDALAEHTRGHC